MIKETKLTMKKDVILKKKGFTMIELMAVVAIIGVLATVLMPNINGYIQRSKKSAVLIQTKAAINAIETHNAMASSKIADDSTDAISTIVGTISDLIEADDIDKIKTMTIAQAYEIYKSNDPLSLITLDGKGDFGVDES